MFSGIIRHQATITQTGDKDGSRSITARLPAGWKLAAGDSIAVNGICSTVQRVNKTTFRVSYMPETLRRTTAGGWRRGMRVNLEQPLRLNDRVHGHLVQGHVDAVGTIIEITQHSGSRTLTIALEPEQLRFAAPKGSVALDGVSLTVVGVAERSFSVALIPYTLEHTSLGAASDGETLNVEVDILAKYVARLLPHP